jgi:hypothetical protein
MHALLRRLLAAYGQVFAQRSPVALQVGGVLRCQHAAASLLNRFRRPHACTLFQFQLSHNTSFLHCCICCHNIRSL